MDCPTTSRLAYCVDASPGKEINLLWGIVQFTETSHPKEIFSTSRPVSENSYPEFCRTSGQPDGPLLEGEASLRGFGKKLSLRCLYAVALKRIRFCKKPRSSESSVL